MVNQKIQTGEILPRDYGISIRVAGQRRLFISPSKYAIGALILETPRQIKARIKEKSQRTGETQRDLENALRNGVETKDGTLNVLQVGRRSAISDVKQYGSAYAARVKSKSGCVSDYPVRISNPNIPHNDVGHHSVNCKCDDGFWNDVKNTDTVCVHAAALEVALFLDNKSQLSVAKNITGVLPRERDYVPQMPFTLVERSSLESRGQRVLTDIIFDYYVEGKPHLEINKALLDNPEIYSALVEQSLRDNFDRAQFRISRQEEREVARGSQDQRLYGAIKALEERVEGQLRERGFVCVGYALEFKGTPYEVVSRRFQNRNIVYSFCVKKGMLPVIVKKVLGEKNKDLFNGNDLRKDSPFARSGEKYISIDDATRRESLTEVILPGMREDSITHIPLWMKDAYRRAS